MPKTDYTYSRSGSYSRTNLNTNVESPNMSRRRIHAFGSSIDNGSYVDQYSEGERFESEDESYSDSSSDEHKHWETVPSKGIELRSGHRLRSMRSVLKGDGSDHHHHHHGHHSHHQLQDGGSQSSAIHNSRSRRSMGSSISSSRVQETITTRSTRSIGSDRVTSSNMLSNQLSSNAGNTNSVLRSSVSSDLRDQYTGHRRDRNILTGNQYSVTAPSQTVVTSRNSSSSLTGHSMKTVKKTLIEEFEETDYDEKGSREAARGKEFDERQFGKESQHGKSQSEINHLYGLDYEEEFSDGESAIGQQSAKSSSSWSSTQQSARPSASWSSTETDKSGRAKSASSWTTVTTVVTVIDTITSFAKPVVVPVWNAVGRPVANTIVSVAQPVTSSMAAVARWMWALLEYVMMKMVLVDVWLLSRSRGRGWCCLCLPLLLLLPLALLGGSFMSSKENFLSSSWSSGSFMPVSWSSGSFFPMLWTKEDKTVIHKVENLEVLNLGDEIRQIIIQLQQTSQRQLSAADVEKIVRSILATELGALKLDLTEDKNKATVDQTQWNLNHATKFEELQNDFKILNMQINDMESKLSIQKEDLRMHGSKVDNGSSGIHLLEAQLAALRESLQELDLSHQALLLQVSKCCRNESGYILAVQDQVNTVLAQMMAGHSSGNPSQDAFTAWLHAHYVSQEELDARLAALAAEITEKILVVHKKGPDVTIKSNGSPDVSEQFVKMIVEKALLKYGADKTGMADYALESAGGSVLSTRCSETYYRKTAQVSIFGIPLWYSSNSPRTVIQPEVHPGQCWAFRGSQGYIVIQLATVIVPSAFALEHIPQSLSPSGSIDTAPRDFSVWGLASESDREGISLGNYTYNKAGHPIQLFPVQIADPEPYNLIMLHVDSNHGNLDYTCLYRFRVHGKLYKP